MVIGLCGIQVQIQKLANILKVHEVLVSKGTKKSNRLFTRQKPEEKKLVFRLNY